MIRSEEEIRAKHSELVSAARNILASDADTFGMVWLKWVLKDSDPKPEHFCCPQCNTVWHNEYNMERFCCPSDPKPIEKLNDLDCRFRPLTLQRINQIIDRLNKALAAIGQI